MNNKKIKYVKMDIIGFTLLSFIQKMHRLLNFKKPKIIIKIYQIY